MTLPARCAEFYQQFIATISRRFKEDAYETRLIFRELVGGGIQLMPAADLRWLIVSCAFGDSTLPPVQLSRKLTVESA
jgi:hypothetical protein